MVNQLHLPVGLDISIGATSWRGAALTACGNDDREFGTAIAPAQSRSQRHLFERQSVGERRRRHLIAMAATTSHITPMRVSYIRSIGLLTPRPPRLRTWV